MSRSRSARPPLGPRLGPRHALHVALLRLWRAFPWPGGRGRYFFKRLLLEKPGHRGPKPIPTRAGWLWLEWGEDVLQKGLYANGEHYEEAVTEYLEGLDLAGQTVLDVGAHAGFYSLLFARSVGPDGQLVAFEPQESMASRVERAFEAAGATWARVVRRAVGHRDGVLQLHISKDAGRTSAGSLPDEDAEVVEVPVTRLDRWIAEELETSPALIKIDIEGAEWPALDGLGDVLYGAEAPRLVVEMHPRQIEDLGGSQEALLDRLEECGYRIRRLHHRHGVGPLERPLPTGTTWHLLAEKPAP